MYCYFNNIEISQIKDINLKNCDMVTNRILYINKK